jgi:hypothetical protein
MFRMIDTKDIRCMCLQGQTNHIIGGVMVVRDATTRYANCPAQFIDPYVCAASFATRPYWPHRLNRFATCARARSMSIRL